MTNQYLLINKMALPHGPHFEHLNYTLKIQLKSSTGAKMYRQNHYQWKINRSKERRITSKMYSESRVQNRQVNLFSVAKFGKNFSYQAVYNNLHDTEQKHEGKQITKKLIIYPPRFFHSNKKTAFMECACLSVQSKLSKEEINRITQITVQTTHRNRRHPKIQACGQPIQPCQQVPGQPNCFH